MRELNVDEVELVSGGDNPGMGPYDPPPTTSEQVTKIIIDLITGRKNSCL
jgi:hypothetical protein